MKKFGNFLKDTIYDLNYFLFTLIILVLIGFVLQNRIHAMYNEDYATERENANNKLSQVEVESIYSDENSPKVDIKVLIPEGSSLTDVSRILVEYKVVSDPEEFINYIKSNSLESSIKNGEFTITKGSTLEEVVKVITGDNVSTTESTTTATSPIAPPKTLKQ